MDVKTSAPLAVSIILALLGYVATYLNSLRLARRKDRIDRLDRQLRELYGPLYALTVSADKAWHAFRSQIGRPTGSFWNAAQPPSEAERNDWCLWMREVLMPINLRLETVLLEHADLLDRPEMPASFLDLLAHVASYKAVLKAWEHGDFSRYVAILDYPVAVNSYARDEYLRLKRRQQLELGGGEADV